MDEAPISPASNYPNQVVISKKSNTFWYSKQLKKGGYQWAQMTKYSRHPVVLNWLNEQKNQPTRTKMVN